MSSIDASWSSERETAVVALPLRFCDWRLSRVAYLDDRRAQNAPPHPANKRCQIHLNLCSQRS